MNGNNRIRGLETAAVAATVALAAYIGSGSVARAASLSEFQVNTYTNTYYQTRPAICAGAESFVVVWFDERVVDGVLGQRIDRFGSRLGTEFRVPEAGASLYNYLHQGPKAACDSAGDFVVVWEDDAHMDTLFPAVIARRFDSLANPLGADFVVSSYTQELQGGENTAVGMDKAGNFVIAWDDDVRAGYYGSVFAQRFDSSGTRIGTEFQVVNTPDADAGGPGTDIAVVFDTAGRFVIASGALYLDGEYYGVVASRFDSDGTRLGNDFQVNTYTRGSQGANIAAAADAGGGFVIVWTGDTDGDGYGVFGQRFDSSGGRIGTQFQVNSHTAGNPEGSSYGNVSVALNPDGGFVVVWDDYCGDNLDGDCIGVFGRQFSRSGDPVGSQFQVNTFTLNSQYQPVIAANGGGDFVVAWTEDQDRDGLGKGIFGSALSNCPSAPLTCANPTKSLFSLRRTIGDPSRSKMIWKWIKGTVPSFGDPTDATSYVLCVYDDGRLVLDYDIAAGPPWALAGSGFKFFDPAGNASGITKIKMKPGTGKAKVIIKGGLANLETPNRDPMFAQTTEVRVQLVRVGTSQCWQGVYPAGAVENTAEKFKDKS